MNTQGTREFDLQRLGSTICMAALFSLVLSGSARARAQNVETIERNFTVEGVPEINVRNIDGETRIMAHEGGEVRVTAVKEVTRAGSEADAEEAARRVEVLIEQIGDRIEVETKYPKNAFSWRGPRVLVHIEIHAPKSSNMNAKSVDGNLEVEGFDGDLELATVDGNLQVTACSGRIRTHSVDGDAELMDIQGRIEAQTVDGNMDIEGVFQALEAKSTDGDITLRIDPNSVMESDWNLRTTDGSIRVTLPEGFGADLDIEADDGSITSDHPLTVEGKLSRHSLQGQIYGGGYTFRIRTSDGSISLK